jgi:hypothetical protein
MVDDISGFLLTPNEFFKTTVRGGLIYRYTYCGLIATRFI